VWREVRRIIIGGETFKPVKLIKAFDNKEKNSSIN
jgi:hypothetical protein